MLQRRVVVPFSRGLAIYYKRRELRFRFIFLNDNFPVDISLVFFRIVRILSYKILRFGVEQRDSVV